MTDSNRLLRLKQVIDLIPVGRSTIYDWMGARGMSESLEPRGVIIA